MGDVNGNIIFWDCDKEKISYEVEKAHTGAIYCVLFKEIEKGKKGKMISGGEDQKIKIWDVRNYSINLNRSFMIENQNYQF